MYCSNCGAKDEFQSRGTLDSGAKRYSCKQCGKFTSEPVDPEPGEFLFTESGDTAEVSATLDEDTINSPEKLKKAMGVDETIWEVYKKQIGKSAAWRKDKISEGESVNGLMTAKWKDSGKIKVVPVYTVKLWLRRKTAEIRAGYALEDFKKEAKKFSVPSAKFPKYQKAKGEFMLEVEMPDVHIGKLTWGEESGVDSDIKTQVESAKRAVAELLSHAKNYPVKSILFPIGNDYFNVDGMDNMTTHGTPQQEDTRWRKTFRIGWKLASELINMCAEVAPVTIPIVGGNHDEERSFYLGEVLSALYANTKRVEIDNSAKMRKYYLHGVNLIGLTHGYHEKIKELKDIMAYEVPELWAKSAFREWHTGDKHHKEDYVHKTHEWENGVVVRILRSLTPPDAWHYNKGYIGALRASEAFLWHDKEGLKGQFTAIPNPP